MNFGLIFIYSAGVFIEAEVAKSSNAAWWWREQSVPASARSANWRLQGRSQVLSGWKNHLQSWRVRRISSSVHPIIFEENARAPNFPAGVLLLNLKNKLRLTLDIFQFIEERLQMLNAGLGFSDEFELEACNYSSKSSSKLKQHYKEWSSTMKKEGSAFFKTVKSKVALLFTWWFGAC